MSGTVIACVPVTADGQVDPRWGRASHVAVARVVDGAITAWQVVPVGWDALHDAGTEGSHHARIARFLADRGIQAVVANHMGWPMERMLQQMQLFVTLGARGDARAAVAAAIVSRESPAAR